MRAPVIVDTPYPTVWQTAKKMGVSRKRTLELIKLAHEIHAQREEKSTGEQGATRKKRLKTA
jgi:hypothetical protein